MVFLSTSSRTLGYYFEILLPDTFLLNIDSFISFDYKYVVKLYSIQCVIKPPKVHIFINYLPQAIRCLLVKITATFPEEINKSFLKHSMSIIRSKVFLEKLIVAQPVKKLTAFYGTRRFITVYIRGRYWNLSCGVADLFIFIVFVRQKFNTNNNYGCTNLTTRIGSIHALWNIIL
jgi:hypothetical protein